MKFTFSWLKEHLDTKASLEEICQALTNIGLEVESVDDRRQLKPFTIAKVLSAEPHPDADKLQILSVDTGGKAPLQIVCGAKNARAPMKGVLAPVGTYIPGLDTVLSVGKIRGVESYGMMCSYEELGLEGDSTGIIELEEDAPIGESFGDYAQLCDPVLDVSVTPNRADCTSVYGIARDLAAKGLGTLKPLVFPQEEAQSPNPQNCHIAPEAEAFCQGFSWCVIRDIDLVPSPQWLQRRLAAIGIRPINAVVDITNYLTVDIGRPLHAYDADKIQGPLTVRYAKEGETFEALNHKTYTLSAKHPVIADASGPLCLAGIMGGHQSGCTTNTKNIILESALWDSSTIAQTGRSLGLISDARYRFERGVDPALLQKGLAKAAFMIRQICGGYASAITTKAYKVPPRTAIPFSPDAVERLTSLKLEPSAIKTILERLGFGVESPEGPLFQVHVPSWRFDVTQSADLVEEVLRIYGVEHILPIPLEIAPQSQSCILTPQQARRRHVKRILASRGMYETINFSFISHKQAVLFGGGIEALQLHNPIAQDMSDMRPSLLPGLLIAAQKNADYGRGDLALFEVSEIYESAEPEGQRTVAAGVRRGTEKPLGAGRFWNGNSAAVDVFDVKQDVFCLLEVCGLDPQKVQLEEGGPAWYHPGRSATLKLGPKNILGSFGQLHPKIARTLKLSGALCVFEIFLDGLPLPKNKGTKTRPPLHMSNFQPVKRDFAFLVDKQTKAEQLVISAMKADKKFIESVKIFDVFEDPSLGLDKKSIALEVSLQPLTHTLTDEEIEEICRKIIQNVLESTGGLLRDQ